jgi:hypothetical protein
MPDRAAFYTANLKFRGDETEKRRTPDQASHEDHVPMKILFP